MKAFVYSAFAVGSRWGVVLICSFILLGSLAQADPLGAWNAKTTLSFLYGRPYKRIPWMLNDTILGTRAMEQAGDRHDVDVALMPNPASEHVIVSTNDEIRAIGIFGMDGRSIPVTFQPGDARWGADVRTVSSGAYLIRIDTESQTVIHKLIITHVRAP